MAIPPPGRTPPCTADFAELSASTIRSRYSPLSTCEYPPTYISAILDYILANLSLCTPFKCCFSSTSIIYLIYSSRSLIFSGSPAPSTILVSYSVILICFAFPKCSNLTSYISSSYSLSTRVAPVIVAISVKLCFSIPAAHGMFTAAHATIPFLEL